MKIKTVASRRKRHELRKMVIELAATVDRKEKEIKELQSKFDLGEMMLKDTTDKLITQKRITNDAAKGNEEMVKDFYEQSKDINRLNDLVVAANAELGRRDTIISNLNNTISDLQSKVINLCSELEQTKKPFWKKLRK